MTQPSGFTLKIMWLAALSLLAACSSPAEDYPPPSPALWEVTAQDGTKEGWLFGTIHELPDGVEWRTEKLERALTQSDWLIVEVSDLENSTQLRAIFAELAVSDNLPPLLQRVRPDYRKDLRLLLSEGGLDSDDFTGTETWAAALTLAQLSSKGDSENGVDRALIAQFAAVIELEGGRKQLTIFDRLPEQDQRDLLEAVVRESQSPDDSETTDLTRSWLTGDIDTLLEDDPSGMLSDPELYDALLKNRNRAWIDTIVAEADKKGPLMIAVGAAHMVGVDGLPALLTERGYRVTRIQ
ncbi:TraB/GumN family protein [Pontixanthobacter aquaemixtae]|uniref:TraB/GumN family protein n=1 Tax=Pontixanthobacter aquaemixtae TaxID=1958940 RepID=A0A844ZSV0_9SPHN|nr:TraB/GumN family protein [Pontixanthobacter aquaemixtae]MXO90200.1 TraB/GumN family protein [Pontixanthobacter aquaemixtae]